MSGAKDEIKQALDKRLSFAHLQNLLSEAPIAPQTNGEHACPYCRSIFTGLRCHACGAPRMAGKATYRDEWPAIVGSEPEPTRLRFRRGMITKP